MTYDTSLHRVLLRLAEGDVLDAEHSRYRSEVKELTRRNDIWFDFTKLIYKLTKKGHRTLDIWDLENPMIVGESDGPEASVA